MSNRPNTRLTQQHLRVYQAQRNTDTPDGGGQMTSAVLTGKDNELFPPVSDLDLALGRLNMRLVYCAVLTDFAAALWGANVILSEPPRSKNVSYLLFRADGYAQERRSAAQRMEAYAVPATYSRMTLLNTQLQGSRQLTAFQSMEAPLPVAGERYCLQYTDKGKKAFEFFRIAEVFAEERAYEDDRGEFRRRFVRLKLQDALSRDFEGVEHPRRYPVRPDVLILETQVADSGQYYGISALAAPVRAGDSIIRAAAAYQQIVPTSVVETAHTDGFAGGKGLWIPTAPRRVVAQAGWMEEGNLYFDTPVLPGSIELDGWTDDASGSLKNGSSVLRADYEKGIVYGLRRITPNSVYAVPAVRYYNHAFSAVIEIDQTNIGSDYVFTLRPRPAHGSVSVAWLHRKTWYQLDDGGDGVLRDGGGIRRGAVSRNGSVAVSLPAPPDDGSRVICTWCPDGYYRNIGGSRAGEALTPVPAEVAVSLPRVGKPSFKPGTVRISWQDGRTGRQVHDQNGELEGSAMGYVDYAGGRVHTRNLQAAAYTLTAEQYLAAPDIKSVAVKDSAVMTVELGARVQPGSFALLMPLGRRERTRVTAVPPPAPPSSGTAAPTYRPLTFSGISTVSSVSSAPRVPARNSNMRGQMLATSV